MKKLILAFILIFCMAFSAHATTEVLYHEWGGYAHEAAGIKYVNGVFTNVHDVLDFLVGSGGSTSYYTTAEVDLKLLDKQNVADMVGYYTKTAADILFNDKASTDSVALKADKTYVDSTDENIIALINGLPAATNHNSLSGRDTYLTHPATSIGVNGTTEATLFPSGTTTATAQDAFDTIAVNFPTTSAMNTAIATATASASVNQTVSVTAGENLTAGDVVSLINSYGTVTAKKNNLAVNTSPNGAERVFNSAATTYCSAVALDSTRFLVAFVDSDTYSKAIVGTINGSSITWGSKTSGYLASVSAYQSAVLVDTDRVIVFSQINTYCYSTLLTVSDSTITVAATDGCFVQATTYITSSKIDTNKAIVCGYESSVGKAQIVSYSGVKQSKGIAATFNAAATSYISVSALSTTSAIVAYQDGGNSNYGTAQVLSISGTTITPGTEYVFKTSDSSYISIGALSSTKAVVAYSVSGGNSKAQILDISGTAITTNAEYGIQTAGTVNYNSISIIDSTHFLVSYFYNQPEGGNKLGTVNGSAISFGSYYAFNVSATAAGTAYISSCYLGNQKSIIAYQDHGNSDYGTAVVNTWATSDYSAVRGIAVANITSGNSGNILLSGEATGLSSLVTGSQYWLQSDFTMGTAPVSLAIMKNSSTQTGEVYLGTAKSATTMYFHPDYK